MHVIRELSNSYEMSKLAIDSMIDHAVYILDKEGLILSSNSGAKNLTGFQDNEITQTHFARFHTMEDIYDKYPEYELDQTNLLGHYETEKWFVRKNGSKFWARIALNRLCDNSGKHIGYSQIVQDLTGKKRYEDNLKLSEYSAQKALKLKSQFIADISHEIRTPLGAMLGFAEFLQKENINEKDKRHYLDVILKNGRNLNHLINDVLDLSKIEAGKIDVELSEFNLNTLIKEVTELFQPQCDSKNIVLKCESNDISLDKIISDGNHLRQILNNILSNAIKFTEKGEINISVKESNKTSEKDFFEILIKDSGIGLDKEELEKIFHPFAQVNNCSNKKIKGSGLGLILAKKMAMALGGDVELVKTTPGLGSLFSIKFVNHKNFKNAYRPKPCMNATHSLKSKSILIVDDSVDNLEIIKLFLDSYGGNPDIANNGIEALEKIQRKNYDVILMDIEMPNMNGFQLIQELHKLKNHTPVIALTAHAMPEDKMKTKMAGFFDHVTKPIDFNYLVTTIETLH